MHRKLQGQTTVGQDTSTFITSLVDYDDPQLVLRSGLFLVLYESFPRTIPVNAHDFCKKSKAALSYESCKNI